MLLLLGPGACLVAQSDLLGGLERGGKRAGSRWRLEGGTCRWAVGKTQLFPSKRPFELSSSCCTWGPPLGGAPVLAPRVCLDLDLVPVALPVRSQTPMCKACICVAFYFK